MFKMNKIIAKKAIQLLNENDCIHFPIDVFKIAQQSRYNIKSYSKSKNLLTSLNLLKYAESHLAFSLKYKGNFYIFVSDDLSADSERKVIAHEIGHIVLHKIGENNIIGGNEYDEEADEFALYLLAPLPLLSSNSINAPEDIKKLTQLSLNDSKIVYQNLICYHDDYSAALACERLKTRYRKYPKSNSLLKILAGVTCVIIIFATIFFSTTASYFLDKNKPNAEAPRNINIFIPYSDSCSSVQPKSTSSEPNIEDLYYWTNGGSVFHSHSDCQALKNSKTVYNGTLSDAQKAKERLCKFCEKRD